MAEEAGFEPADAGMRHGLANRSFRPLRHSSELRCCQVLYLELYNIDTIEGKWGSELLLMIYFMKTNEYPTWTKNNLMSLYLSHIDALYEDTVFRKQIFDYQSLHKYDRDLTERQRFDKIFIHYLEEAALTLSLLLSIEFKKDAAILEVGGGLGFFYGFLVTQGVDITAIEPSVPGYEGYYNAAKRMLEIIGVDGSQFLPYAAEECTMLKKEYDVILSNNVLEHIVQLDTAIHEMKSVLNADGVMIHNTVNYHVPYEPHFKLPLIPFIPEKTTLIFPWLKNSPIWNGLHFVTTRELQKICKVNNLHINFRKNSLEKALNRFGTDKEFSERQKLFKYVYRFLKISHLLGLIRYLPIALTTPIVFTLRHYDGN